MIGGSFHLEPEVERLGIPMRTKFVPKVGHAKSNPNSLSKILVLVPRHCCGNHPWCSAKAVHQGMNYPVSSSFYSEAGLPP